MADEEKVELQRQIAERDATIESMKQKAKDFIQKLKNDSQVAQNLLQVDN